jgi:hypothetical protein
MNERVIAFLQELSHVEDVLLENNKKITIIQLMKSHLQCCLIKISTRERMTMCL